MEERPFGKTGEKFPILSFGAQRIVEEHGCSEKEALKILNHALDKWHKVFRHGLDIFMGSVRGKGRKGGPRTQERDVDCHESVVTRA